jgi:molybdenum cofactor sulfurtransferase
MMSNLYGNPHSASASSQLASQRIDNTRLKVLRLFNADPTEYDVVFVANATAGIKLVMEAFANMEEGFWFGYHRDAHTSLIGVREAATNGTRCFTSDEEVHSWFEDCHFSGKGLFAYPAQSNMNGRRLSLDWCKDLRKSGRKAYSLLDAAALVSTSPLDLSSSSDAPDFTVLSFYKMFGFPDLGALIIRKSSGDIFKHRKYFGGGTVETVACMEDQWHFRKDGTLHDALEDGTLPVHNIIALDIAIDIHKRLFGGFKEISKHTSFLAQTLYGKLHGLKHANGASVCELYGENAPLVGDWNRGPVVALNFRDSKGRWISNQEVQKLATIKNIHIRNGNLCNPGGVSHALCISTKDLHDNYSAGLRCGSETDILGGKPTGVIRVSFGAMSTLSDLEAFIDFVSEFFVDKQPAGDSFEINQASNTFYIESLVVYPIKSCGGFCVPRDIPWNVRPEGLAWDREWCLIHQGTRSALSQKKYPRMVLFRPYIDLASSLLTITWTGDRSNIIPDKVGIPLSLDSSLFASKNDLTSIQCPTDICGDKIQPLIYNSSDLTAFFSTHLNVPVYLARFPPSRISLAKAISPSPCSLFTTRKMKSSLLYTQNNIPEQAIPNDNELSIPGSFPTPPPSPPPPILGPVMNPTLEKHNNQTILLANESPILIINKASVDRLNEIIRHKGGLETSPDVFRANIILNEFKHSSQNSKPSKPAQTTLNQITDLHFVEDDLCKIHIYGSKNAQSPEPISLTLQSPCRRCQMVCIDQVTGIRGQEPFSTLAKTRRKRGAVWFGMHASMDLNISGVDMNSCTDKEEETAVLRVGSFVVGFSQ